jgi:hypothetical protein
MQNSRRLRFSSLVTVIMVLILTLVNESQISISLMSSGIIPKFPVVAQYLWIGIRIASIVAVIVFLWFDRRKTVFWAVVLATALLTVGLLTSAGKLIAMLLSSNHIKGSALMKDVALLALINVLTFSIWYWIIDPPGIDESQPTNAPWEFLFPQRASCLPGYEDWLPRYTDYLALAFYTSVAFSPTDAPPLTRRAKTLMIFQSAISLVTITFIAGSAINILA